MTYQRTPYADAQTMPEMSHDCHEVEHNLDLPHRGVENHPTEFLGEEPAPATARVHTHYEVPDDLAHLADDMELHFD
jgi:hypothetical protein